jgi:excinuclease UvrABC helicase subunit UvrB
MVCNMCDRSLDAILGRSNVVGVGAAVDLHVGVICLREGYDLQVVSVCATLGH